MPKEPSTAALEALNQTQREHRAALPGAISEVESAINNAILLCEHASPLRRALLTARGDIREAMGEART